MKSILLLSFTFVSIKALVLPIPVNIGGDKAPVLRSIETCPGHENDTMVVISGTFDEELCMPGFSTINTHTRLSEDLPMDLVMFLDLQKITPFPMKVPCLDGVGSCEYDMCEYLVNMSEYLCPGFPDYQPCSCPLLKGDFILENVQTPVPDMGPILGAVMEGGYEATATLYGLSNPDKILGCMKMTFSLKQC